MHSIFVLCQNYPSEKDKYPMAFVHPRIKEYLKTGLDVKVISFACNCPYIYDEVQVYTLQAGKELLQKSEKAILIAHAPNIKNHLFFVSFDSATVSLTVIRYLIEYAAFHSE